MDKITHIKQTDKGVDDELQRVTKAVNTLIDKFLEPSSSYPSDTGKAAMQVVSVGNNQYSISFRTKDGFVNSVPGIFEKSDVLNPSWGNSWGQISSQMAQYEEEKINTYYQSTEPSAPHTGDFWFDTSSTDNYVMKRYNGHVWVITSVYQTSTGLYAGHITAGNIVTGTISISAFINDAGYITSAAAGNHTYYQNTEPSGTTEGDFWFDTQTAGNYRMRRRNATTGGTEETRWDQVSVYMDGSGLYASNIDAGKITTGMLTAIAIQSGLTGERVTINESGYGHTIRFYDSTGTYAGGISAGSNGFLDITDCHMVSVYCEGLIYGLYMTIGGVGDQRFEVDEAGNLTKVAGQAASANTGKVLASNGSSYYPTTLTAASVGASASDHNHSGVYALVGHDHSGVYAPAAQGAVYSAGPASGFWVASSSGGPTTAQLPVKTLTINGVAHYVLE